MTEGKFVFVSTVYSDLKPYEGPNPGRPFSFEEKY